MPVCANCSRRQRPCRYPSTKHSGPSGGLGQEKWQLDVELVHLDGNQEGNLINPSINQEELLQRVQDFFKHIYPIPIYAFLHEPSIREKCINGTIDQNLALAIAAVAKTCTSSPQPPSHECSLWISRVEMDTWNLLEKPSTLRLQSLLLVIHHHIQVGRFSRAYMLAGLAARAATALRLNYERPELSFIAQETRRRVLWALSLIDGFFSVGLPEYETIPHTIIYQRLPSSEEAFRDGTPEKKTVAHRPWLDTTSTEDFSLLAACIRLSKVSKDIIRLTRQLALAEQPLTQLQGLIHDIQNDIWRLQADVELCFHYQVSSPACLTGVSRSRWFARYLQISINWHQAHCDLYRLFLPEYSDAAPKIITDTIEAGLRAHAVEKCREHVDNINQILAIVLDIAPSPILPSYVAVCAYHATRLSLFLSSSPDLGSHRGMETAIGSANVTLEVLRKFFANFASMNTIALDMQRLVHLASAGWRSIYEELCRPSPPFDQGRHRHGHLAISSLIRQANFVDEGYED
ncbi:uncharacterized protein N7459_004370 [Penicillium hispanicum]|uniref:uncharacterized protein n=1 Tax=Penicillium hispanicum TaxID=1080232 RepID=UPI00254210A3|nr:uncharacterized protein N7459_004370 [Penicillium hispanicum]KAJ5584570.1 hypothetical protein N7459_004370 [Penicillium hispanicum]